MNANIQTTRDGFTIVDGHCDSALYLIGRGYKAAGKSRDLLKRNEDGHLDLPRLREGGVSCQTFALFADDDYVTEAKNHIRLLLNAMEKTFSRAEGRFVQTLRVQDIHRAAAEGAVAGLLSLEGGEPIGESLDELRSLHNRGIRMIGLTWNRRNAIARGVQAEGTDGLSPFGYKVVAEMEKLGVVVDVSHLADQSLEDVLAIAEKPIVASHSNSRAICPHPRNLTEAQMERIAATGGLIGLCFAGVFIDQDPSKVSFHRLMEHLDHMISVVGPEHVGLGSDFDGFTAPYGIAIGSCLELPRIATHLASKGHTEKEIAAIMGGNWMRVFEGSFG